MGKAELSVCYFGSYARKYSRNKILIDGLTKNNVVVLHCQSSSGLFLWRYAELLRTYWPLRGSVDVVLVGFRGHLDMPLAWLLGRISGKKIIFDAFISIYDTYLNDRKIFSKYSIRAIFYYIVDWFAITLADHVVLDTNAQIDYFTRTFRQPRSKFTRIFVGGDDTVFVPRKKRPKQYILVEWHGIFTRLHGLETVLEAAKRLEQNSQIRFLVIGDNPHFRISDRAHQLLTVKKPKNLLWERSLPLEQLAQRVTEADISLGHFGTTEKALNVLTNKIFHGLAVGNAVIVESSPASSELLTDGINCVFAKSGDAKSLAQKIEYLVENEDVRSRIAEAGHSLFFERLTNYKLGGELKRCILQVIEI